MAKVFLSAGHGGSDPGAVANGLKEKDINLQTLLACKAELERHGVKVIASRTKDENDPVREEVREANASGATLAVSFHTNAGGGDGFEGFYYPGDSKGKRLVDIATRYVAALGQNAHGQAAKDGGRLMFVNSTKMTAALFESFFVDSADRFIGDTLAEQQAFGTAYAKAILEYLGIAYKEQKTAKQIPGNAKNNNQLWYRAHCQNLGWLDPVHDGQTAGTTGFSARLEALLIDLRTIREKYPDAKLSGDFHIQNQGTIHIDNIEHDTILGTIGKSLRLEAFRLHLTGVPDKKLYYEAHVQDIGWQGVRKDGEMAGTTGQSKRIEAVRIWVE